MMPAMNGWCLSVALLVALATADGLELEAESGTHTGTQMQRSAASNDATVLLNTDEYIELSFTTFSTCMVSVENVAYTNDGDTDDVRVSIDGRIVGSFQTYSASSYGYYWNVVRDSGSIGTPMEIQTGSHQIRVEAVDVDQYGVEIDKVVLMFDTQCTTDTECIDLSPSISLSETCSGGTQARIVQRSTETDCAEEDNIHIPVYFDSVQNFTITATLPQYYSLTSKNNRDADFTNCELTSRTIWTFGTADSSSEEFSSNCITSQAPFSVYEPPMSFCRELNADNLTETVLTFLPKGQSSGLVQATIGSVLTVHFAQVSGTIHIEASSFGRSERWVSLGTASFTPTTKVRSWHTPDLNWMEDVTNLVRLQVMDTSSADAQAFFDYIKLDMRQESGEYELREIYNDGITIVTAIGKDFWWLYPQSMTVVNTRTGQEWSDVIYIRVSRKVPGIDSWPEVFVLYQDGNSRILTFPPVGIDWIPFGSSVIIGQSDPDTVRPYAAISAIDIDPQNLQMTLHFTSGGQAVLSIETSSLFTTVTVSDITYTTNVSLPFATFRSMWVNDTNADVDRVSSESGDWHITQDGWSQLWGMNFVFYRTCISKHNTLSPDISIEVYCTDGQENVSPSLATETIFPSTMEGMEVTSPSVTGLQITASSSEGTGVTPSPTQGTKVTPSAMANDGNTRNMDSSSSATRIMSLWVVSGVLVVSQLLIRCILCC